MIYMVDDRHVWFGGNILMMMFVGSLGKDELKVKTRRGYKFTTMTLHEDSFVTLSGVSCPARLRTR